MKVINLIGGANTGKTTSALGLAFFMKRAGMRVELAGEYAKIMAYEERDNILNDQLYILAKQNRTLRRLRKMDWVVTDCSLLLGLTYQTNEPVEFGAAVKAYFNTYDNVTFHFPRNTDFRFEGEGRVQKNHEDAAQFDEAVRQYAPANTVYLERGFCYISQICYHLGFNIPLFGSQPFMAYTLPARLVRPLGSLDSQGDGIK